MDMEFGAFQQLGRDPCETLTDTNIPYRATTLVSGDLQDADRGEGEQWWGDKLARPDKDPLLSAHLDFFFHAALVRVFYNENEAPGPKTFLFHHNFFAPDNRIQAFHFYTFHV